MKLKKPKKVPVKPVEADGKAEAGAEVPEGVNGTAES